MITPPQRRYTLSTGAHLLYGNDHTHESAHAWAMEWGLRHGPSHRPACAHGLRLLATGGFPLCCQEYRPVLDHASLWYCNNRPVILISHPYGLDEGKTEMAKAYAAEHRLHLTIGARHDAWYGSGTTPLKWVVL